MHYKEKYPDEEVEVDVIDVRDQRDLFVVSAEVSKDGLSTKVSHGFRKEHSWGEKMNGTKKFLLKLKDIGLDRMDIKNEKMDENVFEEKRLGESEMV